MFFNCCCTGKKPEKVLYLTNPSTDEHQAPLKETGTKPDDGADMEGDQVYHSGDTHRPDSTEDEQQEDFMAPPPRESPTTSAKQSPRSGAYGGLPTVDEDPQQEAKPTVTPPPDEFVSREQPEAVDEEAEKAGLRTLVNSFAQKAVRGCPCLFLRANGDRLKALYRLDKSLQYLMLVPETDPNNILVTCPIGAIQDIHTCLEDGPECFPPEVVGACVQAERDLLLMVTFALGDDRVVTFWMVESSPEARDVFLQSLRVLGIYAQHASGTG